MEINAFPAIIPNLQKIAHPDSFFKTVKEQYIDHTKNGLFLPAGPPALFMLKISSPDSCHTGLIASVPISAYLKGEIKGHEETLEDKAKVQLALFRQRQAIVKPVLLTYPNIEDIDRLVQEQLDHQPPFLKLFFESENTTHSLWKIDAPGIISQFQGLFKDHIQTAYIADGHHRMSSAAHLFPRVKDIMCAFFPSSEVHIHDFNRLVTSPVLQQKNLLDKLTQLGDLRLLSSPQKPQQKHEISLFFRQKWYRLKWDENFLTANSSNLPVLDTQLLNDHILQPLLGIEDPRSATNIKYIDGQSGLEAIQNTTQSFEDAIAFFLYPVQFKEMMAWADQGQTLPPKSTWFEPRIKNGVLVQGV